MLMNQLVLLIDLIEKCSSYFEGLFVIDYKKCDFHWFLKCWSCFLFVYHYENKLKKKSVMEKVIFWREATESSLFEAVFRLKQSIW